MKKILITLSMLTFGLSLETMEAEEVTMGRWEAAAAARREAAAAARREAEEAPEEAAEEAAERERLEEVAMEMEGEG